MQLKPDDAELWQYLGNVLVDLNRPDQAILSFQHALKLDPRDWKAANNSAHLLVRSGRLNEALSHFDLCDQVQPDCAATLQMRALALYGLNRFEEGLADIKRAHALDPAQPDICNNTAVFLRRLGQVEEALPWFNKALQLRPDYPSAFTNKAAALGDLHRFTEVFATYDELRVLHPDHAEAEWGRALLHLLTGNFEAGWAGREVRWKLPDLPIARFNFPQPMWLGKEPIDGKTILVHVDEGLGDTIQFARYVPMVAALGARVILVVADALCPLLSKLPGVSQCLPLSTATPKPANTPACCP
jgi:tetratricopeptide (TPR) repeat protein